MARLGLFPRATATLPAEPDRANEEVAHERERLFQHLKTCRSNRCAHGWDAGNSLPKTAGAGIGGRFFRRRPATGELLLMPSDARWQGLCARAVRDDWRDTSGSLQKVHRRLLR